MFGPPVNCYYITAQMSQAEPPPSFSNQLAIRSPRGDRDHIQPARLSRGGVNPDRQFSQWHGTLCRGTVNEVLITLTRHGR